jgi:hypothetical protein
MGGARALIASLGASISLVAGAALSLLLVSFAVSLDGFAGGVDASASDAAITLRGPALATPAAVGTGSRPATAVVVRAPAPKPRAVLRRDRAATGVRAGDGTLQARRPVQSSAGAGDLAPPPPSGPGSATPSTGDGVREIGDTVNATVQHTGAVARTAAAPLGPPVSQAVQNVLNLIGSWLEGATNGVAGALDKTLPR